MYVCPTSGKSRHGLWVMNRQSDQLREKRKGYFFNCQRGSCGRNGYRGGWGTGDGRWEGGMEMEMEMGEIDLYEFIDPAAADEDVRLVRTRATRQAHRHSSSRSSSSSSQWPACCRWTSASRVE